jgi:hypothetical protein
MSSATNRPAPETRKIKKSSITIVNRRGLRRNLTLAAPLLKILGLWIMFGLFLRCMLDFRANLLLSFIRRPYWIQVVSNAFDTFRNKALVLVGERWLKPRRLKWSRLMISSIVLLPLWKPACVLCLWPFFSSVQEILLLIILSIIFPRHEVWDIGR